MTIVKAKPGADRIVIGLMGMQKLDMLFDFSRHELRLHSASDTEMLAP